jgi:hypothetical protein
MIQLLRISRLGVCAFFLAVILTGCTSTGSNAGAGVTSEGYTASKPVSSIETTDQLRSLHRDAVY